MKEWIVLMLLEKFEQKLDGMGRIAYSLKERISRDAWEKVKDLFYYDADCEMWLTLNPEEVIDRLKDNEWKLEAHVFQRIANEISLTNKEALYNSMKIIKKYGGAKIVELLRKAVKSVTGSFEVNGGF